MKALKNNKCHEEAINKSSYASDFCHMKFMKRAFVYQFDAICIRASVIEK